MNRSELARYCSNCFISRSQSRELRQILVKKPKLPLRIKVFLDNDSSLSAVQLSWISKYTDTCNITKDGSFILTEVNKTGS
jgi:hypothetical protein